MRLFVGQPEARVAEPQEVTELVGDGALQIVGSDGALDGDFVPRVEVAPNERVRIHLDVGVENPTILLLRHRSDGDGRGLQGVWPFVRVDDQDVVTVGRDRSRRALGGDARYDLE